MILWLRVDGPPVRHWIRDAGTLAHLPSLGEARHELLEGVTPLRSSAGENVALTVLLRNAHSEASALLADPPLGVGASLMGVRNGAVVELFRGTIVRVGLGVPAELEVQA